MGIEKIKKIKVKKYYVYSRDIKISYLESYFSDFIYKKIDL
jgi:hypothetical protein